ncbi:MAG: fimbrillin family protein [Bacteroidales bacterium]|jgi:hypothetical protein|nr:fimbrillin family protein [Bacteroidales bacterium]MCI2122368.1 fimbrillin family protein [Bacteroidales bacterium]MCI2146268.1 fimbrillin family protein [Bacteroidales bacterium]
MKKIICVISAVAILASGCVNEGNDIVSTLNNKGHVTLEGKFSQPDTKTVFGEADNGVYNLTWTRGDAIGIFTLSGTTANINQKATLFNASSGQAEGVFLPEEVAADDTTGQLGLQIPETGSDQFLIYYPYVDGTDINVDDILIHSQIDEYQTQDAVNDKQIGKNGFSYGITTVSADTKKIDFTLTHAMAYIRFVVSSNEFSTYALKSVELFDKDGNAKLSGEFTFDPFTYAVTPVEGKTNPSAKVTADNDVFSVLGDDPGELYLTVLPCDLTNSNLYAVVTFEDSNNSSVSIPMQLTEKGNLPAGSMTTITLSNVSSSSNSFAWYEPDEPRALVDGWCYGAQNTYLVQRSPNEGEWTELTFDVKARGDFSKVEEPKYYGMISTGDVGNNGLVLLGNGNKYESVPTTPVSDDYKITVKVAPESQNCGSSAYGVVSIYDADYKVIWTFMIQAYFSDDVPSDIEYPGTGFSLLDRNLGAKYSATKEGIENKGSFAAYFQWGRPVPFMWSNSNQTHYSQRYVTEDTDLETVISNPSIIFASTPTGLDYTSNGDWKMGEHRLDMWGAVNKTDSWYDPEVSGEKTIYDPCPKGYRVASGEVLAQVKTKGERNEIDHTDITETDKIEFPSIASVVKYPLGDDKYDYWIYAGGHWGSNSSWGNRTTSNNRHAYLYWANCTSINSNRASVLEGCYFSSGWGTGDDAVRSQSFAVRCMKDENDK